MLQVPVLPSEHDTGSFQLAQLGLQLLNCKLSKKMVKNAHHRFLSPKPMSDQNP